MNEPKVGHTYNPLLPVLRQWLHIAQNQSRECVSNFKLALVANFKKNQWNLHAVLWLHRSPPRHKQLQGGRQMQILCLFVIKS